MRKVSLLVLFLLSLAGFVYLGTKVALRTRASGLNLNLVLKLQGNFPPNTKIKLRLDLYSNASRVATFRDVELIYGQNNLFEGIIMLNQELDLTKVYALYIKPEKYLGQLFCSLTQSGECTTGGFTFTTGLNRIDLREKVFYAGDLAPQDGRVDSADISRIFAQIGKSNLEIDINQDGVVNGVDYTLAQRTLSLNLSDDPLSLEAIPTVTPTPTSILTP